MGPPSRASRVETAGKSVWVEAPLLAIRHRRYGVVVSPTVPAFRGTREQHLVRVVFLLRHCGTDPGPSAPNGALSEMRSQLRLQALDFWLRNPDYLADDLLNEYDRSKDLALVDEARRILDDREPEVRRLPMTKYMFGAYEPLDDVLAPLVTYPSCSTLPRPDRSGCASTTTGSCRRERPSLRHCSKCTGGVRLVPRPSAAHHAGCRQRWWRQTQRASV